MKMIWTRERFKNKEELNIDLYLLFSFCPREWLSGQLSFFFKMETIYLLSLPPSLPLLPFALSYPSLGFFFHLLLSFLPSSFNQRNTQLGHFYKADQNK